MVGTWGIPEIRGSKSDVTTDYFGLNGDQQRQTWLGMPQRSQSGESRGTCAFWFALEHHKKIYPESSSSQVRVEKVASVTIISVQTLGDWNATHS